MRKMLLGFCLFALIFTGQALAADTQKVWEEGLTQFFAKKNLQVQAIEYSAEKNTVTVKGISGVNAFMPDSALNIESIVITEPNPLLFEAKGEEVPLIGAHVDMHNVQVKLYKKVGQGDIKPTGEQAQQTQQTQQAPTKPENDSVATLSNAPTGKPTTDNTEQVSLKMFMDLHVAHIGVSKWQQNLVELAKQDMDKNPEGYYKAALNVFMEKLVYSKFSATINDTPVIQLYADKAELSNVTPGKIASLLVSKGGLREIKTANVHETIISFDSLDSTDLGTPSAEHMAFLHTKGADVLKGAASTEDTAKYNALSVAFNQQSPRWQFTLKGLRGENLRDSVKKQFFTFNETQFLYFNDPETDAQMDISLKVLGAAIDPQALDFSPAELDQLPMTLLTQSDAFDFTFETSVKTNKEFSTLSISLADPKGPSMKIQAKALLPETKLSRLLAFPFDESMFMSLFMGSTFVELSSESNKVALLMPGSTKPALSWDSEKSRLVYDHTTGKSVKITQDLLGWHVDLAQVGSAAEEIDMLAAALGSTSVDFDAKTALTVNTDGTPSLYSYDVDVKDQAALHASLDFMLPEKKISELVMRMDAQAIQAFLLQGTISGAKITFTEKSLLAHLLAFASKQIGQSGDVLIAMATSELNKSIGQVKHLLTDTSAAALASFLKKPGELTITATSKEPLGMASLGSLMQPGIVTIDVQNKEGADLAQASAAFANGTNPTAPSKSQEAKPETKPAVTPQGKTESTENVKKADPSSSQKQQEKQQEKQESAGQAAPKTDNKQAAPSPTPNAHAGLTAPEPKVAGKGVIIPSTQDVVGLNTFGPDQKPDACARVLLSGISPLTAVRLESISGKIGSWKTKDVKNKAIGVLAVMKDGKIINANDEAFSLDVLSPTVLDLCVQDNGAIVDAKTRLRVIFFHKDGSRKYSVIHK